MSGQNHQPMNRKITAVAMLLTVLFCVGCENKLESAKKLWQENSQDQAISKLKEELIKNPGNAEATKLLEVYQLALAKKLWQENKQEQAISKLKEELTKNPGNADAAKLLEVYQTEVDQQNLEIIAREILETKIAGQSKGMVKLVDFEKANGIKQSFNGMEFYILEYSATVEFPQETWGECGNDNIETCFKYERFHKGMPSERDVHVMDSNGISFTQFNAGSKVKTAGKMSFQKTEKGWRGN